MNNFRRVLGWTAFFALQAGGLSFGAEPERAAMMRPERLRHWQLFEQRIDIRTGEIRGEIKKGDYDTLPECSTAQAGRIERVQEDAAEVWTCRHDASEQSI